MEIYGIKEANLNFNKVESSSKDENSKLTLVHYSLQPLLWPKMLNLHMVQVIPIIIQRMKRIP
jgi:hypothetical protein